MKKSVFTILVVSLFYSGCEKDFDTVVDQNPASFQVTGVRTIDAFKYIPGDSLLLITITFNNSSDIKIVFSDIYAPDGARLNSKSFGLLDNGKTENGDFVAGDNTFSNKFPLSQSNPNGKYTINYYVEDKNYVIEQVAIQSFNYDNGQTNIAPLISNTNIDPDTLIVADTTLIQISVKAEDQNGLNDIERVYFIVTRPDGSSNNTKVDLYDDGKITDHGDQTAGDGIFSLKIQVDQNNMKGSYRFEFQAIDRGKKLSNIINHFVLIQ
jgi:hypothetical protein